MKSLLSVLIVTLWDLTSKSLAKYLCKYLVIYWENATVRNTIWVTRMVWSWIIVLFNLGLHVIYAFYNWSQFCLHTTGFTQRSSIHTSVLSCVSVWVPILGLSLICSTFDISHAAQQTAERPLKGTLYSMLFSSRW